MRKIFTIKNLILVFAFLWSNQLLSQEFYDDGEELSEAVNGATTGGEFVVKNGTYADFEMRFENMATAENPIIVRAESVGGVVLTGSSYCVFKKSSYITLEGFVFDCSDNNTLVKLEGCNNIRITRNVFETDATESVKWVYVGGVYNDNTMPFQYPSHHNRIDHNIFQNKTTPGHFITIDGSYDSDDNAYQSQYDVIDHNYFKNNGPRAVNEQESIRIGWSDMSNSSGFTTVEFNLFEDCDGDPEIVSVKSCDNIIRHNTFKGCYGTLSFRHGNRNRAEGNYFFGNGKEVGMSEEGATLYTGGIRIYGTDHVIVNNYFEGLTGTKWDAPITLTLGDAIDGQSSNLTKHFRAENIIIAYNTLVNNSHGIEIGFDNNGKYSKDLANILIANNLITGSENSLIAFMDDNDQGDNITWKNNLVYPVESASLVSGATTTTFEDKEVINEDPQLVFDENDQIWKSSSETPLFENGVESENVSVDIEGQSRPASSNPGCDHFSEEEGQYKPLTTEDVGPYAYEDDSESEILFVSSVGSFAAEGEEKKVAVTANLEWSVAEDYDWISVSPSAGQNNDTILIAVAENVEFEDRVGYITISGGTISRTLTVTQQAADVHQGLYLINDGSDNDNVSVYYVFDEEVTDSKNNVAEHALDKDFDTQWSGFGYGGEIIFDLGAAYDLALVDYATTDGKTYELQIWVSSTGAEEEDFVNAFPDEENLVSNTNDEFKSFLLPSIVSGVRYVKIIGYGQPSRPSEWNTITEIEFYAANPLSVVDNPGQNNSGYSSYFVDNQFYFDGGRVAVKAMAVFDLHGKMWMKKRFDYSSAIQKQDLSFLPDGIYIVRLTYEDGSVTSKKIIVSH
ncbi:chondroitinase-B domain-containing protein [Thermophagus sp. OGC60D27]|uniref:chondroitinase-B domain-containing protein n=1 Tax=Thermophagus sp. OGC60D27 TaxID=3458415 RepID=UPI004037E1EC